MTRVHAERELPTSKSLYMSRNSKLFTAPTGAQVNIFTSYWFTILQRYCYSSWGKQLKEYSNWNKTPQRNNKKPHPNRKPPPKSPHLEGFYKSSVLLTPLTSVTCSVLYEIAHSSTAWKRGASFKNKHFHGCPKTHQSQLQGTLRQREQKFAKEHLKLSPWEDGRFSMLRKPPLKLLARLNI